MNHFEFRIVVNHDLSVHKHFACFLLYQFVTSNVLWVVIQIIGQKLKPKPKIVILNQRLLFNNTIYIFLSEYNWHSIDLMIKCTNYDPTI